MPDTRTIEALVAETIDESTKDIARLDEWIEATGPETALGIQLRMIKLTIEHQNRMLGKISVMYVETQEMIDRFLQK